MAVLRTRSFVIVCEIQLVTGVQDINIIRTNCHERAPEESGRA